MPREFGKNRRIHQVRVKVVLGGVALEFLGEFLAQLVELDGRGAVAGAVFTERGLGFFETFIAEHDTLDGFRKTAVGPAKAAAEHVDDALGEVGVAGIEVDDVGGLDAAAEQEERHVADHLARGRDLHDVAEELVDLGIGARDLGPAVGNAHAGGLFLEVGVLAAGHFVEENLGAAGLRRGVERRVELADFFPVIGEFVERVEVQLGVARRVLERGDDAVEVRLRGAAGHRGDGEIDNVHTRLAGLEDAGRVDAAGVVRVEVDRNADLVLERLDQFLRGERAADAGHVFDREEVRAHLLQLLRELHVVLEGEFVPSGIEDVAGVADGGLANRMGLVHRFHRDLEVRQVVERIEDAENVHARRGGVLDETGDDVVRVVRVADGVGAAEKHLETDVRNLGAQLAEAFPRVFVEETHRRVERRAAPHLQRKEPVLRVAEPMREGVGAGEHVGRAHARGHERLVRVAEGGVGDEQALLLEGPLGEALCAELEQEVTRAGGRRRFLVVGRGLRGREGFLGTVALGVGIAVDDDVAEEVEELGRAVAAGVEREEFRRGVDERRGGLAALEVAVADDVFEEGDVGLDAADAELGERAVHAVHRDFIGLRARDDFHEERVVEGRDDRAAVAHAAVEPDAETAGRAVGENLAVVRHELVLGILGGDPALDRVAVAGNLVLHGHPDFLAVERVALGDENLGADEIKAGDDLGDGVLDLDARVHLDEEPLVAVEVVEELDGAGIVVFDLARDAGRGVAQLLDDVLGQAKARRDLDDFLVATLHRAIALVQMNHVAVLIAEHLHLDVLGARDVFLEEHGGVAKRATRLGLGLIKQTR